MSKDRATILAHFRDEAEEHIEALAKHLLALEVRPDDERIVADLLRHAHSLKGASKLVGGTELERLTHALETILVEVRARRLAATTEVIDPLIVSVDAMRTALDRLMEGTTDGGGSEGVVSRLLLMAASAPGLDDRLTSVLPGLDPEIREVLTEFQKSQLVVARDVGKTCWEVELDEEEAEFTSRIDDTYDALKTVGDVVSLAGLSPLAGGRLRFKFVVATRKSDAEVMDLAATLSLVVTNPSLPKETPQEPTELSEDEAAFAEEMAKLVAQYVVEAADEVDEAGKLVLALEANPSDAAALNSLFRAAHSLKGSGMTYGLSAVSDVAHQMETVLAAVRDGRIAAAARVTNALLTGIDALKDLFARAGQGKPVDKAPEGVLRLLHDVAANITTADVAPDPAHATSAPRVQVPATETIRVRLNKLDRLVNLAGELTIVRNAWEAAGQGSEGHAAAAVALRRQWQSLRDQLRRLRQGQEQLREQGWIDEYEAFGARLNALSEELEAASTRVVAAASAAQAATAALQDAVMNIRMVPVAALFNTAPRMLRDLTADKQKSIDLQVSGEDTELDKRLLEMMTDPLMHLLRNAADHGIEPIAERIAAGKPQAGVIQLSAEHRGGHIMIILRDDGRGMDPRKLAATAVARGLVAERDAERLSTEQAHALIFHPGFSTKEEVTAISGRGVGMDVVQSNIDALKGRIEVESAPGIGTTFRVLLPLSLSVIQVVLVDTGGRSFCLPATAIAEIIRVAGGDARLDDGKATVRYRDRDVPILRLSDLLGFENHRPLAESEIVIATGLEGTVGFVVDRAVAEQTVLVKQLGKLLKRVPHVAGATVLSSGRVAVILDMHSLAIAALRHGGQWVDVLPSAAAEVPRRTLLVVDDSLTTRELIRGLLEAAGYDVVTARHGREAWDLLQTSTRPDLVVSDVSMPEMDGYQLTSKIKGDERLSRLPVVLVTSLSKPEEEARGMEAGADAYIVKGAFNQTGLLARVEALIANG
jgi:two-component system chemotaxis sensor kinase CheA